MLHCSCTTDVCIFMENVSSFDTFSESHKLNLPRGWVYCLMDILNCVTQQVLQRALGITILSDLYKPGLILNIFLEEAGGITWVRTFLGISFLAHLYPRCPRSLCSGAVLFGLCQPRWAAVHSRLSVSPRRSSSPDLCGTVAWHSRCFVRNDPLCSQSLTIPLLSRIKFEFSPVSPEDHLPRHKSVCSYWPSDCWTASAPLLSWRCVGRSP